MLFLFFVLGLSGCLGCIALFKKPIALNEVRWLASRETLKVSSGNRMHCKIYGYLLYCEYSHIPGEEDRLLFKIGIRKGALTAAFENGKLLWWSDGRKTYEPDNDTDPCHANAVWLWESILGAIENVVATRANPGAQAT